MRIDGGISSPRQTSVNSQLENESRISVVVDHDMFSDLVVSRKTDSVDGDGQTVDLETDDRVVVHVRAQIDEKGGG